MSTNPEQSCVKSTEMDVNVEEYLPGLFALKITDAHGTMGIFAFMIRSFFKFIQQQTQKFFSTIK